MTVKEIKSLDEFRTIINCGKHVAINFWVTWDVPCKEISPVFEALSKGNNVVGFYKVDADDQQAIAQEVGVRAMPTFIVFKDGNIISELVSSDQNGLRALVTNAVSLASTAESRNVNA